MIKKSVGYVLITLIATPYLIVVVRAPDTFTSILYASIFISSFWLWSWMFSDLLKNRNLKHKVIWGWMFLLFNVITAIIYFLTVFKYVGVRPKEE